MKILKAWLELLFPPLCQSCKEPCQTRLFCPDCWELCSPPDPEYRCRHCFSEIEEGPICQTCQTYPRCPFPSAFVFEPTLPALRLCKMEDPESLAAFAIFQWNRLGWPLPDIIIPLLDARSFAKEFASCMNRPCFFALQYDGRWNFDQSFLEEEIFLLLAKTDAQEKISAAIESVCEAFPKKVYVLSLLHDLDTSFDFDSKFSGDRPLFGHPYRASATGMDCPAPREILSPS